MHRKSTLESVFRARAKAASDGVCGEAPAPGSKAAISELVEEVAAVMHETACLLVAGSIVLFPNTLEK